MRDINRDKSTVTAMIAIYCRRHHSPAKGALCESCRELAAYASHRLELCPHGLRKSSCRRCPTHCYSPRHRQQIAEVMRYSGPRIIFYKPLAAMRHLFGR